MGARIVPIILVALLAVFQAQLWFGRGSIPDVMQMREKLAAQKFANAQAQVANERLASEVADLKQGLDMVEEKARMELGMVKPNEIFVQVTK
ncbi:MAG: septation ring formation regulator EzrA [Burkholderiaceae bacterium]|nr:MAG: septation ring formation regulator EzrA [Burkholderiaceae bacterium]